MFKIKNFIITVIISLAPLTLYAAQSANYMITESIINASGTTYTGSGKMMLDSLGEGAIGQSYGSVYSIQTGFFNDYYILPPTPTVTPTITVTGTPIRQFGSEVISKDWVYAAPNPIRGHIGHIYYHLAESADVEIKVYTTSNQFVISKRWDMRPAGKNYWQWNMSNLANGVYIMRVKARGINGRTTIVIKKIALIK
ncbi:T9SS type A sorting domain-containing protein [bacterium]|nr:T9SS type A sorting domain-containing protein [bacterium]